MSEEQLTDYGVIPPSLAIESMRRNGYLTTDNAIAEIIDNSLEADAELVEVFLFERPIWLGANMVMRIERIGVLDDGHGMAPDTLRKALVFGGGDRYERRGMGRFGFGLPNSSISQANRLEVWTWQNGPSNAVWTYLDVVEVKAGEYESVPEPIHRPLPPAVEEVCERLGTSGTYVQWSNLDPDITWKRGRTVIKHTDLVAGRLYRYFLTDREHAVRIRMAVIDATSESALSVEQDHDVIPNDPLYLLSGTSCPWDDEPMFQPFGEATQFTFKDKSGVDREVLVRISYARPDCREARGGVVAGNLPHGRHAVRNQGVSVVRADRELQLEDVVTVDRFRDRWWGVEISFPPQLDELLGVSNNKQGASNLIAALKTFDGDVRASVEQLIEQGDLSKGEDRVELYRMAQWIVEQLRTVGKLVRRQNENEAGEGQGRHDTPSVEDRATTAVKRRAQQRTTEDEDVEAQSPTPLDVQREEGRRSLIDKGYEPADAEGIISAALDKDRKVLFVESKPDEDGDQVFSIDSVPGARVEVVFNVNHPAHAQIFESLAAETIGLTEQALRGRIEQASNALKILFAAWTRMELEGRQGPERTSIARMRRDWGRMAADFLEPEYAEAMTEPR